MNIDHTCNNICSESERNNGFETVSEVTKRVTRKLKEKRKKARLVDGITTGYIDLDYMTGGFHSGELIVIAGRPAIAQWLN